MEFDLSYAPADTPGSTTRRQVALATGTNNYANGDGDPVSPEDLRMGLVYFLSGLMAVVAGVVYIGAFSPDGGPGGTPAVFWYNAATGAEAVNGTNFSTWGQFPVEAVGR